MSAVSQLDDFGSLAHKERNRQLQPRLAVQVLAELPLRFFIVRDEKLHVWMPFRQPPGGFEHEWPISGDLMPARAGKQRHGWPPLRTPFPHECFIERMLRDFIEKLRPT